MKTANGVCRINNNTSKGKRIPDCWGAGQPRHLALATFDKIVKDSKHLNGKAVLKDSLVDYIREEQEAGRHEHELEPITQTDFKPRNKTLNNYYTYLCSLTGMSIKTSSTVKT